MSDQRFPAFPEFHDAHLGAWDAPATAKNASQHLPLQGLPWAPPNSQLPPQPQLAGSGPVPWPYGTHFNAIDPAQTNHLFAFGPPGCSLVPDANEAEQIVRPVSAPAALPSISANSDGFHPDWQPLPTALTFGAVQSLQWPAYEKDSSPSAPPSSACSSSPPLGNIDSWVDGLQLPIGVPQTFSTAPTSTCSSPPSISSVDSWAELPLPFIGDVCASDRRPSIDSIPPNMLNEWQLPEAPTVPLHQPRPCRKQIHATLELSAVDQMQAHALLDACVERGHDLGHALVNDAATSLQTCSPSELRKAFNDVEECHASRRKGSENTDDIGLVRHPVVPVVPSQRTPAGIPRAGELFLQAFEDLPPISLTRQGPPSPPFRQLYGSGTIKVEAIIPRSKQPKKKKVRTAKSDSNGEKTRQKRTAMACVPCRETKRRCDGGQPCGSCVRRRIVGRGGPCAYVKIEAKPPRPRKERAKHAPKTKAKTKTDSDAKSKRDASSSDESLKGSPPRPPQAGPGDVPVHEGVSVSTGTIIAQETAAGQGQLQQQHGHKGSQRLGTEEQTPSPLFDLGTSSLASYGCTERCPSFWPPAKPDMGCTWTSY